MYLTICVILIHDILLSDVPDHMPLTKQKQYCFTIKSRMGNPETKVTLGTQDTEQRPQHRVLKRWTTWTPANKPGSHKGVFSSHFINLVKLNILSSNLYFLPNKFWSTATVENVWVKHITYLNDDLITPKSKSNRNLHVFHSRILRIWTVPQY